jgi:hypothetical protein
MSAINTVQKYFPKVEEVFDAEENATIEVTRRDEATSKRRAHGECAMAIASKRVFEADGVIVSLSKAFVVKGKKAYRYDLPENVSREVISFDRGSGFSPGTYQLKVPAHALGKAKSPGKHPRENSKRGSRAKNQHHMTQGIRTVLGSKEIS